jgi:hypothetical protein
VQTGVDGENDGVERQLQEAVDFRGDVTITLNDGSSREGYMFSLGEHNVEMFPAKEAGIWTIPKSEIASVQRSGRDPADGKSWEAWVKKYNENKARRESGETVAPAGLYPDPL